MYIFSEIVSITIRTLIRTVFLLTAERCFAQHPLYTHKKEETRSHLWYKPLLFAWFFFIYIYFTYFRPPYSLLTFPMALCLSILTMLFEFLSMSLISHIALKTLA